MSCFYPRIRGKTPFNQSFVARNLYWWKR